MYLSIVYSFFFELFVSFSASLRRYGYNIFVLYHFKKFIKSSLICVVLQSKTKGGKQILDPKDRIIDCAILFYRVKQNSAIIIS